MFALVQRQRAMELFAVMQCIGLEPAVITHEAAISAGEKAMPHHEAVELLARMQQKGSEPIRRGVPLRTCSSSPGSGCDHSNATISACEEAKEPHNTEVLLAEMHQRGWS